jgi:hypothetical protein
VLSRRAFYAKLPAASKRRNKRGMWLKPFADCVTAFLIAALVPAQIMTTIDRRPLAPRACVHGQLPKT